MTTPKRPHTRTLLLCLLGLTWGIAITVGAVPLYRIFCQHFGIPVPQIIAGSSAPTENFTVTDSTSNRTVTVRFTANTQAGLPVAFHPTTYTYKVKLGEPVLTAFAAKNNGSRALDGVAVHMLYAMGGSGSQDVSSYVDLQQCFCFAQEHYPVGQDINLPLAFTLSPKLPEGIHTITFAYTLFEALPDDPRIKPEHPNAPQNRT
ncbi:MAG: hypothetical protein EON60_08780 [Alphaproteobacteria bacterium]|nr:MAG: hypothetical protein EON60_08780 [Alphaproteobacteria bacterium]